MTLTVSNGWVDQLVEWMEILLSGGEAGDMGSSPKVGKNIFYFFFFFFLYFLRLWSAKFLVGDVFFPIFGRIALAKLLRGECHGDNSCKEISYIQSS